MFALSNEKFANSMDYLLALSFRLLCCRSILWKLDSATGDVKLKRDLILVKYVIQG